MLVLVGVGYTNGEVGQAFSFDGTDHRVIVSDAPVLNFGSNQDFSIESWVQPFSASTTYGVMSIVDKRLEIITGSDSPGYELSLGDGRVETRFMQTTFGP